MFALGVAPVLTIAWVNLPCMEVTRPQTSHGIFLLLIFAFGIQRADGEGEGTSAIGPDGEVNASI